MKAKLLLSILPILSTCVMALDTATISPDEDPIYMCDDEPYLELNAIGGTAPVYTWTVTDDTYAYGPTFYFVPPHSGAGNYIIRLYEGVIANQTVDKDPAKLLDEVTIVVNDCSI